ncbi:PQQ-binding-like beta-propeller repeat protein, partial [Verrucomicrobiales bacterium]|nr:PQQ-binding-like beta-propeller repeat protein [Verrucomicrobiales bacterium]
MKQTLTLLSFILLLSATAWANWNQFRGPNGDGNASAVNLPTEFSDTKNVRWRTAIHDQGHSSPVIWGDQIWMTSGHADNSKLFAICVGLQSGKILHDIVVFDIPTPKLQYPKLNSPASPTPFVEEGRVYVHFGTFGTACLDTKTGEKLWERTDLHCDHRVRAASSPIIDGDLLYLTFDGVDVQFFVALNKHTGKTVWRRERSVNKDFAKVLEAEGVDPKEAMKEKPGDNRKSYATPTIIDHAGRRQVVSPAAEATYGYEATTGEELWHVRHPGMGWNVTCRPIYRDGLVYFNTGISKRLFAVDPSGAGNVTDTHVKWTGKKNVSHIPTFVIENELIFMVSDQGGLVSCLDVKTGEQVWRSRLGAGREHWASPIAANGKVYFSSKAGDIAVIAAEREFKLLAKNAIDGTIN